ncbi:MAG: bifunctional phosphopantothenoylcysteine decarboxylase/phosphopantothenate--cysteine ligase CoaBC [Chloroflexi bacterium]|nr:bifunctional phosphopantothenoylcysteine decarboxylase/phosphopantothenate--cysteine ligase CoaBC [Chloroflexota bacterium]|tara:strand:+ start:3016 stop:4209 length:1194 start_codon:yes stop_codon:yes gene_type:complete
MTNNLLEDKSVLLGVTGSIAAYKAVDIASQLIKLGANVNVALTEAATKFITPFTFKTITGNMPYYDMWDTNAKAKEQHIELAHNADLMIIAPATASTIATLAYGMGDDSVSLCALSTGAPKLIAPAMDHQMWNNKATQENINKLIERGDTIILPEYGRLASGEFGLGRLSSVDNIIDEIKRKAGDVYGDLCGKHIVITAGGTREPLDPVRFLSNRSSGKMGFALAEAARNRGSSVTLISSVKRNSLSGVHFIETETTDQMFNEVKKATQKADALIMAAAVSDFKFKEINKDKIKDKNNDLSVNLTPNPDIIASVEKNIIKVAFAAETKDLKKYAEKKLFSKNAHFIVANDVSDPSIGFNSDNNKVTIISDKGKVINLPIMPKIEVSHAILNSLKEYF